MAKIRHSEAKYAALYERLSRDDEQQGESNSITNQKSYLEDYALRNGFENFRHFTDDGYSGVTFDRPSFNQMVEEIKAGNVSTVIVKDLSRIGRNYLKVGFYTEVLFQESGVRFIAVNNGVDSEKGVENDFTPFINIMNEWYAKDTSNKIRAIFKSRMEKGKRCSGAIPYGYVHDPADRQHLLVDERAAEVVRRIFQMTTEGKGVTEIARTLAGEKVLIPSAYFEKYYPESCRNHRYHDPYDWSATAVTYILNHEEYLGHTILSKSVRENFKKKTRRTTKKDERIVYRNTHEAIIDQHTWDTAQKCRRRGRKKAPNGTYAMSHRLSGVLYCADCGHRMTYKSPNSAHRPNGKIYDSDSSFGCGNYRSKAHKCTAHYIKASTAEKLIKDSIVEMSGYVKANEAEFYRNVSTISEIDREREVIADRKELSLMKKRVSELDTLIKRLYEDNAAGKISERLYDKLLSDYDEEQGELEKRIRVLEIKVEESREDKRSAEKFVALVKRYTDYSEITDTMINEFIDKVVIHETYRQGGNKEQQVDIYFSFIGKVDVESLKSRQEERERAERERYSGCGTAIERKTAM